MPCPSPTASESHAAFVQRAHRALRTEIPDAEDRSLAVISAWRKSRRDSDVEQAPVRKYAQGDWHGIEYVPVFKEHEYPRVKRDNGRAVMDDDGNPVVEVEKYDFGALAGIVENMNHRIADTGDFSPVCDRHTPSPGSAESKPRIVGFAGPFYLGQIGNRNPKWAIYALEHWYGDKATLAREMPRRSAEVYLGRPMNERVLDPIAALGADTPALDMGIHYSEHKGELVAKYSGIPLLSRYSAAAAPATPGSSNVALPEVVGRKTGPGRAKYDDDSSPVEDAGEDVPMPDDGETDTEQPSEENSVVSPEDVNMIVEAMMQTEPMQFLLQLMQQQQAPEMAGEGAAGGDMGGGMGGGMEGGMPPGDVGGAAGGGMPPGDMGGGMPPGGDMGGMPPEPDGDEMRGQYSLRQQNRELQAQYSQMAQRVRELESQVAQSSKAARQKGREAELNAMRLQGFPIDLTDEMQRCSVETMTDEAFQLHLDTIAKYAAPGRIPVNLSLPIPDAPITSRRLANGEPDFTNDPRFAAEVQKACYAEQCKATYNPSDRTLYERKRAEVIEQWQQRRAA